MFLYSGLEECYTPYLKYVESWRPAHSKCWVELQFVLVSLSNNHVLVPDLVWLTQHADVGRYCKAPLHIIIYRHRHPWYGTMLSAPHCTVHATTLASFAQVDCKVSFIINHAGRVGSQAGTGLASQLVRPRWDLLACSHVDDRAEQRCTLDVRG